jgi:sugar lactone lactonase YvrE
MVTTLAGIAPTFERPTGVAVDSSGNIYVADMDGQVIKKISPDGVVTTFAGSGKAGHNDGSGTAASFYYPGGIAVDSSGDVYVKDVGIGVVVRKISPDGLVTTLPASGNGSAPASVFKATDSAGNVYASDFYKNRIQKTSAKGAVTTFAGSGQVGHADGRGTAASFNHPGGVAMDSSGNVYVADYYNNMIRKITPAGVVTTLAGSGQVGYVDGRGAAASFNYPNSVAVDSSGNVYVADEKNREVRKITPDGVVKTVAGSGTGSMNGPGNAASFASPSGVTVDSSGNVYVADSGNNLIRKIAPDGMVETLAGSGTPGHDDGRGTSASFNNPNSVAVDSSGNVYVSDNTSNLIRKITPDGVVRTLAGTGKRGQTDGPGAAASFSAPEGIAVDSSGDVYVLEFGSSAVRKITPAGVVTTLGARGQKGHEEGRGIAVDSAGNVYVADLGANMIRKIAPDGVATTLAGSGQQGRADGRGTTASFLSPFGVAVDSSGNVYVTDSGSDLIRKVTRDGVVTTLAGAGSLGDADGAGAAASFNRPLGIAVDSSGNVYVADSQNNLIRKIQPITLAASALPARQQTVPAGNAGSASPAAAAKGYIDLLKTGTPLALQSALQKGASATDLMTDRPNEVPGSPLMYAARYNTDPGVISVLLAAGAKLNEHDPNGSTSLMWAASVNPNPGVISALLNAGAEIEAEDDHGLTALMYAASSTRNPEIIITLLKAGADGKKEDLAVGKTAFEWAQGNENLKGTDALLQLEAASK